MGAFRIPHSDTKRIEQEQSNMPEILVLLTDSIQLHGPNSSIHFVQSQNK